MKILLLAVNSAWTHTNPALFYFRELIRELPYQVEMEELTLKTQICEALELIYPKKPDLICLSVYIWNRIYLQKLIPELRKLLPDTRFILGGPEVMDAGLSSILQASDIVIEGCGEAAFKELAAKGFAVENHNPAHVYQADKHLSLAQIPFAYRSEDKKLLANRLVYYETGRGCPFACVYCLSANDSRNEKRFDITLTTERQKLHSELDTLISLEPRTIKFIDRSFNIYPELAQAIWKYIIALEYECEFHFEIYPDLLREEDLQLLEQVPENRIRFEIGIQSTNNFVMDKVQRKSDWKRMKPILLQLRKRTNIRIHTDLICGLPTEDKASVIRSVNEIAATFPHEIQLGMLKILPNTPMQKIAMESAYLYLSEPPYQVLASDALTFEEICHFENLAHCINLYWNKGDFCCLFETLMIHFEPYEIFLKLMEYHQQRSFTYHSMEQRKRFALVRDMIRECFCERQYILAYQQDWQNAGFRGEVDLK